MHLYRRQLDETSPRPWFSTKIRLIYEELPRIVVNFSENARATYKILSNLNLSSASTWRHLRKQSRTLYLAVDAVMMLAASTTTRYADF